MNTLDKLFSREINRRTGAHAINIYIEKNKTTKKRSRSIGSSALKSSQKTIITTKQAEHSFFYRLNIRFPWLKLVAICFIGLIIVLDLCDVTISRVRDPQNRIRVAPMSKHIRATNRSIEGKKLVALTFDDGPSDVTTPQLLNLLGEKDVLATFFMLGSMARNYPDIVKRVEKEHHIVASHTMYHQNLIGIPENAAKADIEESKSVFNSILGHNPAFTRPPYGNTNGMINTSIGTPIILWSVDPRDWADKNVDAIVNTAMSQIHDGAIVLMHDIYPTSIEAVSVLIDRLRGAGYEFVTIQELAKARGVNLENGVIYYNLQP